MLLISLYLKALGCLLISVCTTIKAYPMGATLETSLERPLHLLNQVLGKTIKSAALDTSHLKPQDLHMLVQELSDRFHSDFTKLRAPSNGGPVTLRARATLVAAKALFQWTRSSLVPWLEKEEIDLMEFTRRLIDHSQTSHQQGG
jgi:hypothetical protein